MLTYKEYKHYKQRRKELHIELQHLKLRYKWGRSRYDNSKIDLKRVTSYFEYIERLKEYRNAKNLYNAINDLLKLHKILYKQTLK